MDKSDVELFTIWAEGAVIVLLCGYYNPLGLHFF